MTPRVNVIMNCKVFDNYLEEDVFQKVESYIKNITDWEVLYFANRASHNEEQFQFLHTLIEKNDIRYPKETPIIKSLLKPLFHRGADVNVIRARVNMFIRTSSSPLEMGLHEDWDSPGPYSLLLYNEDSDGATQFKNGEKILSKRNRAILFDATIPHQTIRQTTCLFRYNININFSINGTQRLVEFNQLHETRPE